jgi:integrase
MARPRSRSSSLESAHSRLALPPRGKSYRHKIAKALWLLYRRNKTGGGTWSVESSDGHGKAWVKRIGTAADLEPSDGRTVIDMWEAIEAAKKLARGDAGKPLTIYAAVKDYADDLKARGSSLGNATRLLHHLPAELGDKPIGLVTARDYARWKQDLLDRGLAPATLKRTAKIFSAALELACRLNPPIAVYREGWHTGLSGIHDVHRPRDVFLNVEEISRLVAKAYEVGGEAFGNLIRLLSETGTRSSQAARIQCADLQPDHPDGPRVLVPRSKKGRHGLRKAAERVPVPVTFDLAQRLAAASQGRSPTAPLLTRADGGPWRPEIGDHSRLFRRAAEAAGLPGHTIYSLRHAAIGRAILNGMPLRVAGALFDTSSDQIERVYARHIGSYSGEIGRRGLNGLAEALR